jgi:hypothetical protein
VGLNLAPAAALPQDADGQPTVATAAIQVGADGDMAAA